MKAKQEIHKYWRNPNDMGNNPEEYLDNGITLLRSDNLYKVVSKYFGINAKILELGSNVGRNLNYLYSKGYKDLTSIEINNSAVKSMLRHYPECYGHTKIIAGSIEDNIKKFKENEFELIYVMAVLEHLPVESEWIFNEMIRISQNILTIEDEKTSSWKHCPRNYNKIFSRLTQRESKRYGLKEGFYRGFRMRLFTK